MGCLNRRAARRGCALVATAVMTAPAAASAGSPDRFPVAGRAIATAQSIARAHWGLDACGGQVALSWADLSADLNGDSTWSNPTADGVYDDPSANYACAVRLNANRDFGWPELCTVVVHEYGHLTGHRHRDDPDDVMAPRYRGPVAECARTPDPTRDPAGTAPTLRARADIRISTFLRRSLPVACDLPAGRRCTVRLGIGARTIGTGTAQGRLGHDATITVRPLASGRRYLQSTRQSTVRATLTAMAPDGRPSRRAITLRR